MNLFEDPMNDFSLTDPLNEMGMNQQNMFDFSLPDSMSNLFDSTSDYFFDLVHQNDVSPGNLDDSGHYMNDHLGQTDNDQISFAGIYTDAEIKHLQEVVDKSQYEVNQLKDEVHHHENMVSLVDTDGGHSGGAYANEVDDLNEVESQYNDAISRLNDAKEKLNNAT